MADRGRQVHDHLAAKHWSLFVGLCLCGIIGWGWWKAPFFSWIGVPLPIGQKFARFCWWVGWALHLTEALYAYSLAKRVDPQHANQWFFYTFLIGFPVINRLTALRDGTNVSSRDGTTSKKEASSTSPVGRKHEETPSSLPTDLDQISEVEMKKFTTDPALRHHLLQLRKKSMMETARRKYLEKTSKTIENEKESEEGTMKEGKKEM